MNVFTDMETVQAHSLEDFFLDQDIDRVDLMKMDCEGAEYEILFGVSERTLARIDRLIMEYHDVGEGRNHHALVAFLVKSGFVVRRVENLVHPNLGYLYAARQPK